MEPVEYLRLLRRRWRLLAACLAVTAVVALVTTPGEPSGQGVTFEAEHVLLRDAQAVVQPVALAQLALFVKTGAVPDRVAERLDRGTASQLASRVTALPDEASGALTITARAPTRERAVELANAFGEETLAYISTEARDIREAEIQGATDDVDRLQSEIDVLEADIDAAEADGESTAVLEARRDAKIREYALALDEQTRILEEPPPSAGYATLAPATVESARSADAGFETPRSRPIRLGLALVVGLILGVIACLIAERLDPRIHTLDTAQTAFDLPVIAEVPRFARARKKGAAQDLVFAKQPLSPSAEAYRSIRSAILLTPISQLGHRGGRSHAKAAEPSVVLVTSPTPGDGKTTTVANLAAAFAETGRSVLVLSCDFRRPEVHNYFDVPHEPGLSDVLTGRLTLTEVVKTTSIHGVFVAADGGGLRNLGDLASDGHAMIDEASTLADVVLIDTPPILATNDAAELISAVDAVVVVCRSGGTTVEAARRSRLLLERLGTPVVGVALTAVPESESSYADYYYTSRAGRSVDRAEDAAPARRPLKADVPEASPAVPAADEGPDDEPPPVTGRSHEERNPLEVVRIVRSERVLSRELEDRVMVLQGDDELLTLEGGAMAVWDELAEPVTVADLTRRLAARHDADPAEIAKGVQEVVARLLDGGAVEVLA
jgi:capsular exopolysaccharide synthesis family protein